MMKKILILCMTFICILSGCRKTDSVQNTEQKTGYKQVSMEEGLELMKEDSGVNAVFILYVFAVQKM